MPKPRDIWPDVRRFPKWLDAGANIPKSLARTLASYTPHRDGWVRWHEGKTIFVCGKRTPLEEIEARWEAKRQTVEEGGANERSAMARIGGPTFAELASAFYEFNDACVQTGRPKRLSAVTAWDYQRVLTRLGQSVGAMTASADLAPALFSRFAIAIKDESPARYNTMIAYVEAFVRWCLSRGYLANNAILARLRVGQDPLREIIGHDLVKLPAEDLRDSRLSAEKSLTPDEIRALWNAGDSQDRLWIALGLNGALDNADLSNLTRGVIDLAAGRLDYRRRKRGKVRRVIPLHHLTALLLSRHLAGLSGDGDDTPVFRTPNGHPLQRLTAGGHTDYVAARFRVLMFRAGLRKRPASQRIDGKRTIRYMDEGDRRGFRSLRTTFPNLAPPGYGDEVEIIMGHAKGGVLLDNYLERFGFARLATLVDHVMHRALTCVAPLDGACPADEPSPLPAPVPALPGHTA